MGVEFRLVFYAADQAAANAAAAAAFQRIEELNQKLSDYLLDSELSRLCRSAPHAEFQNVSNDLYAVLHESLVWARRSEGAFDPTVGPIVRLWRRARRQRELPPPDALAAARARVGFDAVELRGDPPGVRLTRDGVQLDLGGVAKGYAIDAALSLLAERGFPRALVDGGGDVAVGEAPPDADGWVVSVAPLDAADATASRRLLLRHSAVAASGDAWQFLEVGGVRYSHIVDPHTGLGLTERIRATVVAPICTIADAAATTVSVLGVEAGLRLITEMQGCEALLVAAEGDRIVQRETAGFAAFEAPEK